MVTEHTDKELAMEALEGLSLRLNQALTWDFFSYEPQDTTFDFKLQLHVGRASIELDTEVKTTVRETNLSKLIWQRQRSPNFLLIANYVSSTLAEQLRVNGINYMDKAGNAYLNFNTEEAPILIWIDGQRPERLSVERADHAFTKAGLRVTYWYLTQPQRVNEPIRTIAQEVGVGLETVHRVRQSLQQQQFLIWKTATSWLFVKRAKLLDKWIDAYTHRLKPSLLIGHYTLVKGRDLHDWRDWPLPGPETSWGGEPAADLLTDYIRPAHLTLYTRQAKIEIMRHFRLLPAGSEKEPTVSVYQKFWLTDDGNPYVHPLLVYADLMSTGSARNAEVAQILYEKQLSGLID